MPARTLRWRNLVPGLLSIAGVALVALGILKYGRIGALRGDTYLIYTFSNEARGVLENSDVWLAGQRVGKVEHIDFRPIDSDTAKRLRLTLKILSEYAPLIRRDSYAQIRSGGRMLGEPVVYITIGTEGNPAIPPEGVVASREQADPENVASDIALASLHFPEIINNSRIIKEEVGRLMLQLDSEGEDEPGVALRVLNRHAAELTGQGALQKGTIGLFLSKDGAGALLDRVQRLRIRVDSLTGRMSSQSGNIGRMSSDTVLQREIANVRNEASIVRALLERSNGTAGRFMNDSALTRQLIDLENQMGLLLEDLKRDPARYILQ
jgi:phospholipid/cholesterol/gamma-HCH transport system substrate-binding protein